jgi:peptide deformylase
MKLPLTYYGNPVLRKKGQRVEKITDEVKQLVKDMQETMIAHDGLGLASPQVNHSLALFITGVFTHHDGEETLVPGEMVVYINPKILEYSKEEWLRNEGCLSIPGVYGSVMRPLRIKVEAMDLEGLIFTKELVGLEARAFMHENDHINGVLFIDRIHRRERQELEPLLKEVKKNASGRPQKQRKNWQ